MAKKTPGKAKPKKDEKKTKKPVKPAVSYTHLTLPTN